MRDGPAVGRWRPGVGVWWPAFLWTFVAAQMVFVLWVAAFARSGGDPTGMATAWARELMNGGGSSAGLVSWWARVNLVVVVEVWILVRLSRTPGVRSRAGTVAGLAAAVVLLAITGLLRAIAAGLPPVEALGVLELEEDGRYSCNVGSEELSEELPRWMRAVCAGAASADESR